MFLKKVLNGNNFWGLYLLTLLIVFIATQLGSIPFAICSWTLSDETHSINTAIGELMKTNLGLALLLLTFLFGFIALFLCVKYIHQKAYMDIVTARKQFDWKRFFFATTLWLLLAIIFFIIDFFLSTDNRLHFQFNAEQFFPLLIITLFLFPFQTSFEEFLFRGYITQWVGYLSNNRWIALIVPALLFGLMHTSNPEVDSFGFWVAMPQYILMGLLLSFLAIADNGLELPLGLHYANNAFAALTVTSSSSALQTHALFIDLAPQSTHSDTIIMLFIGILFIYITNKRYHFLDNLRFSEKIR